MTRKSLLILLLTATVFSSAVSFIFPCPYGQFRCKSSQCIENIWRCDGNDDCGDYSDEEGCVLCSYGEFRCRSNICIEAGRRCDNLDDCGDYSDEHDCDYIDATVTAEATPVYSTASNIVSASHYLCLSSYNASSAITASKKAESWLNYKFAGGISEWKSGALAHKIIVALFLALQNENMLFSIDILSKFSLRKESLKDLADELSIQLLSQLTHKKLKHLSSNYLSPFVNALLVTCRDPRQFYGMNLVQEIRSRVDGQNYTNPYDLLTLCNAGDNINEMDKSKLIQAFRSNHREVWTDVQAIAVMALSCADKQPGNNSDREIVKELANELKKHLNRNGTDESFQTTALVMQAMYAAQPDEDSDGFDGQKILQKILSRQHADGSFGSFAETYYVLPVLNCKSLVDISSSHCQTTHKNKSTVMEDFKNKSGTRIRIHYSLWFGEEKNVERILTLKVLVNTSFFEIMQVASGIDDRFSFKHVTTPNGKPYITAVSGILDDPEGGKFWFPYKIVDGKPIRILTGPADVIPKKNDHLVMWYRSGAWMD